MKRTASGEEKPSVAAAHADADADADAAAPAPTTADGTDAPKPTTTDANQLNLGHEARRARVDDGSNPALELAIETDDELEAEEMLRAEGAGVDDLDELGAAAAGGGAGGGGTRRSIRTRTYFRSNSRLIVVTYEQ